MMVNDRQVAAKEGGMENETPVARQEEQRCG